MHRGAAVGEARTSEKPLKESQHKEASEILDQSRWDGQDDEDEHCNRVNWTSADNRDFAEGRKNQWSYAIGEDVEGEGKRRIGWGDAELFDDAGFARGVNRGPAVDGERIDADEQGNKATLTVGPVLGIGRIVCRVPVHQDVAVGCFLRDYGQRLCALHLQFRFHFEAFFGVGYGTFSGPGAGQCGRCLNIPRFDTMGGDVAVKLGEVL